MNLLFNLPSQLLRNTVVACRRSHEFLILTVEKNAYDIRNCSQAASITHPDNANLRDNIKTERRSASVPKTNEEYQIIKQQAVKSPENSKVLTVALLGLPNTGKSTLTNALMKWRVCSVSKKVHTTQNNAKAVYVDGVTQIEKIFVDTPGLISHSEKKRHNLPETMLNDPKTSVQKADIVAILIDASNRWMRYEIDPKVMALLKKYPTKKTILILNKVDLLKHKRTLLDVIGSLTGGIVGNQRSVVEKEKKKKTAEELIEGTIQRLKKKEQLKEEPTIDPNSWPLFQEIFMVSALTHDGIEDLRNYLLKNAKSGPWHHPSTFVTDQNPKNIILEAVREKLLDHLPKEIPYQLKVEIEQLNVDSAFMNIVMNINCHRPNIQKLVIGPRGEYIARIAEEAKQDLMNTFRCDVSLKLIVQHKP